MTSSLIIQTQNAFDFLEKFYLEISYLIKEIEGYLKEEAEQFEIGRPGGYGVTSKTSSGLEPHCVTNWFPRSITVSFIPHNMTRTAEGGTITLFNDNLKLLIIQILLCEKRVKEPIIYGAFIMNIVNKKPNRSRFEQMISVFSYHGKEIFASSPGINYSDTYCSFEGEYIKAPLFSINSSENIECFLKNILERYRQI